MRKEAERIRDYVAHVAEIAGSKGLSDKFAEWKKWSLQVADDIDQSKTRADGGGG